MDWGTFSAFFDRLFRMRMKAPFTPASTNSGDPGRQEPVATTETRAVKHAFRSLEKGALAPRSGISRLPVTLATIAGKTSRYQWILQLLAVELLQ
jgi:hypothetical protein